MRPLFLAVLLFCGCSVLGLSESDEGVTVRLEASGLVVENRRSGEVFYGAFGENSLALFAPCVRSDCPRLDPGETRLVPFDEVHAPESSRIRVYWWERAGDVPGPVRTIVVVQ